MPNSVKTAIVAVVTVVWAINFLAPLFVKGYVPSPELNIAFMAIIGAVAASYHSDEERRIRRRRRKDPKSGDNEVEPPHRHRKDD